MLWTISHNQKRALRVIHGIPCSQGDWFQRMAFFNFTGFRDRCHVRQFQKLASAISHVTTNKLISHTASNNVACYWEMIVTFRPSFFFAFGRFNFQKLRVFFILPNSISCVYAGTLFNWRLFHAIIAHRKQATQTPAQKLRYTSAFVHFPFMYIFYVFIAFSFVN